MLKNLHIATQLRCSGRGRRAAVRATIAKREGVPSWYVGPGRPPPHVQVSIHNVKYYYVIDITVFAHKEQNQFLSRFFPKEEISK